MYFCLPACYLLARRGIGGTVLGVIAAVLVGATVRWAAVLAYAILVHRPRRRQLPAWLWPAGLLTCALIFVVLDPSWRTPERGWPFCLAVGLLIPHVRELRPSVITRGASTIAKYSYGIYLMHVPALAIAFGWYAGLPQVAQWGMFLVLLTILPVMAYWLVGAPGIRLGQRLATPPRALAAPAPAL